MIASCCLIYSRLAYAYHNVSHVRKLESKAHFYKRIVDVKDRLITAVNINKKAVPVKPSDPSMIITADLSNQSEEEKLYLDLHKCPDLGEAYGAAYIITKSYLLHHFVHYNLSDMNCEMGSMVVMNYNAKASDKNATGLIIQSLDVLNYAVIHLSAYERLQRRHEDELERMLMRNVTWNIDAIVNVSRLMKQRYYDYPLQHMKHQYAQFNRTIVIMPFLGSEVGAGHSKTANRYLYLEACFWNFYTFSSNIVVFVMSLKDYDYIKNVSKLPFSEIILLRNLPTLSSLPVASVQYTKERLADGRWNFDYIFFTESDQLLLMRIPDILFQHLDAYPNRVLTPHRLWPYPKIVLDIRWKRSGITELEFQEDRWMNISCCMPRQNCNERKSWISIKNHSVPVLNIYGLDVALGNANFHRELYRSCKLYTNQRLPYCP
jgi:hypothetical protein